MSRTTISGRTLSIALVMAALIGAAVFTVSTRASENAAFLALSIANLLLIGLAAGVCLVSALSYKSGERVRRSWLLIGIGIALFVFGGALSSFSQMVRGVSIATLADLLYLGSMPFLAVGMIYYALGFVELVDRRRPALISLATIVVVLAAVWFAVLNPILLANQSLQPWELIVAIEHPLFDVLLVLAPAVYLSAFVSSLGAGRLSWPWWSVAVGAVVLAVTDTAFTYVTANDTYVLGGPLDYGWMVGFAMIALGSLLQRDVLEG